MWPTTRERMRKLFEGVPLSDVEAIVGDNFLRAYKLDRSGLAGLVAEIGPTPADLGVSV
jgi:hypothetical protein